MVRQESWEIQLYCIVIKLLEDKLKYEKLRVAIEAEEILRLA
jgi:hypothetical protein